MEWNNISSGTTSNATLTFYYANATTINRQAAVTVNGIVIGNIIFSTTGSSWDTWKTVTMDVPLKIGSNSVRVTANTSNGGPNLDKVVVSFKPATLFVQKDKLHPRDLLIHPAQHQGL